MRWLTNFYNFRFQWTATAGIEYTLLKPYCHSWWISKMQSGREDTLEDRYAIKFCFKIGNNATETYGMLQTPFRPSCLHRAPASKRKPTVFSWGRTQLTFSRSPKILHARFRCMTSFTFPGPRIFILTFVNDTSSPRAR